MLTVFINTHHHSVVYSMLYPETYRSAIILIRTISSRSHYKFVNIEIARSLWIAVHYLNDCDREI